MLIGIILTQRFSERNKVFWGNLLFTLFLNVAEEIDILDHMASPTVISEVGLESNLARA